MVLFAFLAVACSSPVIERRPKVLTFSCEEKLQELCADSLAEWNLALAGTDTSLMFTTEEDADYRVENLFGTKGECTKGTMHWAGCCFPPSQGYQGLILLDPSSWHGTDEPDAYALGVLLHEIGHALGLGHQEEGIMFPVMRKATSVDPYTTSLIRSR